MRSPSTTRSPGAYTTLGVVLSQTGRQPEAVAAWQRAVALNPGEFDALYNLTMTLTISGGETKHRTYGERYVATAPPGFYGAGNRASAGVLA